jgi:acid phosphatase
MAQHRRLGAAFRSWLVDGIHFLSKKLDPSEIFVRATSVERTIRSAVSFLHGLYEPESFDETVEIVTGTESFDPIRPNRRYCREVGQAIDNFSMSKSWTEYMEKAGKVLQPVRDYLGMGVWDFEAADHVCDWVVTLHCNEREMPWFVNSTHVEQCFDLNGRRMSRPYSVNARTAAVGFSIGMREMLTILDRFVKRKDKPKFVLLSAHDSTVSALLVLLGNPLDTIPPYASHVQMQVLEREGGHLFVRFVFNGQVLTLPAFDNRELVELDVFTSTMKAAIDGVCV